MPRLNNGLEILKGISKVEIFQIVTTSPGDTVTTAALAPGGATIGVSAITNFTAADPIFIIGDGGVELNAIGTPATTMPLTYKAALAQSSGARLVEAVGRNIGHVDPNGVQYNSSVQLTPVDAATSVTPLARVRGQAELGATIGLRGWNNQNLALVHGQDEAETGAGTLADPHQTVINGLTLGNHSIMCARVWGYRFDSKTVMLDFLNCTVEVGVQTNIGGSTPGVLPLSLKFDALVQRIW